MNNTDLIGVWVGTVSCLVAIFFLLFMLMSRDQSTREDFMPAGMLYIPIFGALAMLFSGLMASDVFHVPWYVGCIICITILVGVPLTYSWYRRKQTS